VASDFVSWGLVYLCKLKVVNALLLSHSFRPVAEMFSRYLSTPKKPAQDAVKTNVAGPGQPLELVQYDTNTGKFAVGQQALMVLRNIKGPVGVVSVCGRARQGKSYILNQLLGQSSGFVVASSQRPCTKGLWMWSAPVSRQSADGSKYHLVRYV
jgi:Guanylate-binding protein, N-terminal domain